MAESKIIGRAKMSLTVVEPDPVGRPIIIAYVDVGPPVPVNVSECCRQSPIERRVGEHLIVLVQECALRPRNRGEMSLAVIEVQNVRFAIFEKLAVDQHQAAPERGWNSQLSINHLQIHLAMVPD